MSEYRVDKITNQSGTAGPQIAGITTFSSTSGMLMPSGNTARRLVSDFVPKNIIDDGLVLYLDAGNSASYSGSGTTWTDLSGNDNTGTLTNGPTYSSANGGSIVFDGTNDYVSLTNNSLPTGDYTINCWIKSPSTIPVSDYDIIISTSQYYWYLAIFSDRFRIDNNSSGTFAFGPTVTANTFYNLTVSRTSNIDTTYVNSVNHGTVGNSVTLSGNWEIGRWANSPSHYWNSNIYQVSIYNRALTATEVTQNFNALRSRYSI